MNIYGWMGLAMMTLLLAQCAPALVVNTDYDRDADFSEYETFYWTDEFRQANGSGPEDEPLFYNTLVKKRLKEAIERVLEGKGYMLSEENPDLLVNAQVVVEERNDNRAAYYGPYSYFYWGFPGVVDEDVKEGDVVIELIDQDEHQLVWQGYAPGALDMNTEDRQEEINEAVSMILSEYNYRAGASVER